MHGAVAAQVFGCAGAALSVGLAAPQAWTTCRHRRVSGLSPAARWTAVVHSVSWLVYGLVEGVPLQIIVNSLCGALHTAVLCGLLLLAPAARSRPVLAPQALLALAWMVLLAVCGRTGVLPVGSLAAVAGVVSTVPQLWHLLRHRGEDTSGVSQVTTALALAAGLCWAGHGALLHLPAVALPSLVAAGAAAATLVLLRPDESLRTDEHLRTDNCLRPDESLRPEQSLRPDESGAENLLLTDRYLAVAHAPAVTRPARTAAARRVVAAAPAAAPALLAPAAAVSSGSHGLLRVLVPAQRRPPTRAERAAA